MLSNIYTINKSIPVYNTCNKNYSKNFQDPTRDLLDPRVEFVSSCPYFGSETIQFFTKNGEEVTNQIASLEFSYLYISTVSTEYAKPEIKTNDNL